MDARAKQLADLKAQCKCQTCGHPHHERRKISNRPVRCNKGMSVGRGIEHCPCETCTCQLCVLDEMMKHRHRNTYLTKTLEDIESDVDALIRRYPNEPALAEIRKLAHNALSAEGKHEC